MSNEQCTKVTDQPHQDEAEKKRRWNAEVPMKMKNKNKRIADNEKGNIRHLAK